jgi:hypothetical protein
MIDMQNKIDNTEKPQHDAKLPVVGSGDLIERNILIEQFKKSKAYYEGIGRFDYSAGFEKAIYLTATIGKKMEF